MRRASARQDLGPGPYRPRAQPSLAPRARPRRSGTGATQLLHAPGGRPAGAGPALVPPTLSWSRGRGPETGAPARPCAPVRERRLPGTRLGPPRLRPLNPRRTPSTQGWPRPAAPVWVARRAEARGWAAPTRGPPRGAGGARGGGCVPTRLRGRRGAGLLRRAPGRRRVNGPPGPRRTGTDLPWDPSPAALPPRSR